MKKRHQVMIRLNEEELAWLDELAAKHDRSRAYVVGKLVRAARAGEHLDLTSTQARETADAVREAVERR